ncbi:10859_t:CDS:2 [Ambispora gerdemannii]|uniref:10859_t:CDS:1 n=1 Tax=Ambispora gerdemannii TaxID=144530 RepID=A0A9N8ZEN6_9GLOM|nr:10859_t:CDS:2 [Ambispora gerdemannii]
MKFLTCLALLVTSIASVSAHTTMGYPLPRGHPNNPNAATKDYNCLTTPLNGGPGCAPKAFPCGGYPQDTKITQTFKAGDVIDVKFWNPNFPNGPQPGDESKNQARHNGGLCEFALSYDGGQTYTVIGTYHQTCPDIFYSWKVKIPDAAPSCDTPGKCIFSWSWINALGNREFYQNCADVKIVGTSTKPLPIIDITRSNLPGTFSGEMTPPGDPSNNGNAKGSGPSSSDTSANLALTIGGSGGGSSSDSGSGNSGDKSSSDKSGSCTDEGKDSCASDKSGSYRTCVNGKVVTRQCPGGTVCHASGDSIHCGTASRKI